MKFFSKRSGISTDMRRVAARGAVVGGAGAGGAGSAFGGGGGGGAAFSAADARRGLSGGDADLFLERDELRVLESKPIGAGGDVGEGHSPTDRSTPHDRRGLMP